MPSILSTHPVVEQLCNSIGFLAQINENVVCQTKIKQLSAARLYPIVPTPFAKDTLHSNESRQTTGTWRYIPSSYKNFEKKLWLILDVYTEHYNTGKDNSEITYVLLYSSCSNYRIKITPLNITLI